MPRDEETPLYGTSPVEDTFVSRAGESRGHRLPLDLRQTLTALGTTRGEHLAPTLRRLTRAVSDFPFSLQLRRLPCHLHSFYSFQLKCLCIIPHSLLRFQVPKHYFHDFADFRPFHRPNRPNSPSLSLWFTRCCRTRQNKITVRLGHAPQSARQFAFFRNFSTRHPP